MFFLYKLDIPLQLQNKDCDKLRASGKDISKTSISQKVEKVFEGSLVLYFTSRIFGNLGKFRHQAAEFPASRNSNQDLSEALTAHDLTTPLHSSFSESFDRSSDLLPTFHSSPIITACTNDPLDLIMSDNPASPLRGETGADESRSSRPSSQKSTASTRSKHSNRSMHSEESIPLLSRDANNRNYGDAPTHDQSPSAAASSLKSLQDGGSSKHKLSRRWPTILSLTVLAIIIILILCLGFAAPEVIEEYAREAMVFEPTDLSIDSFASTGVRARIRGDVTLDGSRVQKKPVRDLGRAGTWIARAVESKRSKVKVYLPEYGNLLLGTADVPPIVVDIRNGHTTHLDFLSDLAAGDLDGIRGIADDWLEGRIGDLSVRGVAEVPLKSGIFGLGTQSLAETIMFKGKESFELLRRPDEARLRADFSIFRARTPCHTQIQHNQAQFPRDKASRR